MVVASFLYYLGVLWVIICGALVLGGRKEYGAALALHLLVLGGTLSAVFVRG
jgi:hypothetical protein